MKRVKEFLSQNWDGQSFLLVGYSGGPDSKALLYSLLDTGFRNLHIAHVDHGWREESSLQALEIEKEIQSLGLPFSSVRLESLDISNKEAKARDARIKFFTEIYHQYSCQALVLAHQADDLAETSLKRVLEGSHLCSLAGMSPISTLEGMNVWRPLLSFKKLDLIQFLEKKGLSYIDDPTNRSLEYLRSRMRVETLPLLEKSFGKNFLDNLCLLSQRSLEFRQYLDKKTEHVKIFQIDRGFCFEYEGLEKMEVRYLIQKIARRLKIAVSRPVFDCLLGHIDAERGWKKFFLQNSWICLCKGWVFMVQGDRNSSVSSSCFCEILRNLKI